MVSRGNCNMPRDETHPIEHDENGLPVSRLYGDHFYSRHDGQAETRHVFLNGNSLPDRWAGKAYFSVAELGFGTGLNFLELWQLWRKTRPFAAQLSFTSFEAHPLHLDQMRADLDRWQGLAPLAERLLHALPSRWPPAGSERPIRLDRQTQIMIVVGDAGETVPAWPGRADCWFLDGFAPSKNPGMWTAELMRAVHDRTARGGTFATYTAAGHVRRNLADAGFSVQKRVGFAGKREMLVGRKAG